MLCNLPKWRGWKFLAMSSCLSSANWLLHLSHLARTSPSFGSSQPFSWQLSWSICFPTISPSRSKMMLMVASIPLRVHGLSFNSILNLNASDSVHQCTSSALSIVTCQCSSLGPWFPLLYLQSVPTSSLLDSATPFFPNIRETTWGISCSLIIFSPTMYRFTSSSMLVLRIWIRLQCTCLLLLCLTWPLTYHPSNGRTE